MEDLLTLDITYMMLPLDESPFAINANTRTITSPKIVILQNDQIAETVLFTIDRYFDYMDLNNAIIYVQWTLPSGKTGASKIEMRDISTVPGKIRFGWPLDSEVTSEVGVVKYSVRFWNKGFVTENEESVEKVVYSFNTLTSSLTVSPSLQPEVNEDIDINAPVKDNIFKRAIRNSLITNEGVAIPVEPLFSDPGLDLPATASLDENDTLTLRAQATVGDTGHIEYEWYYKPAVDLEDKGFNANTYYPFNSEIIDNGDGTTTEVPGFSSLGGSVVDEYKEVTDLTQLVAGEQYYVEASETSTGYAAYTGTTVPTTEKLYERYTTYTVPSGEAKVTGNYQVRATNFIKPNTSKPVSSNVCQLISPDDVVITADLPSSLIIERASADLQVKLIKQTSSDTALSYSWNKGTDSNIIDEEVETNTTGIYTVASPGWYQVTAAASLNRESKSAESKICKVTFEPVIPAASYGEISKNKFNENWNGPMYDDEIATLDLEIASVVPEAYNGYSSELFSEQLTYTWTVQVDENPSRFLTNDDVGTIIESGLGTPTLVVKNPAGLNRYTFKCIISNTLNGKTVTSSEAEALPFYVM